MTSQYERRIESVGLAKKKGLNKFNQRFAKLYIIVLLLQLLICSLLALLMMFKDFVTAYSVLFGGMIYLLPMCWFVFRLWMNRNLDNPQKILANVYISKAGKMALGVVLFVVVFLKVEPLDPLALFITYIFLQITSWYLQLKLNERFLKL
ncbi:MAG: hypothetical protein EA373_00565 [Oceanospirillales bacterium]|nr:MAG: hypothetical protein EA373_00565 [Oceanospirillales bacterium]